MSEVLFGTTPLLSSPWMCIRNKCFEVFSCLKFCLGSHPFFHDLKCAIKINFEAFNCLKSRLWLHLFFSRPQMCLRKNILSNICKVVNVRKRNRKRQKRENNEERSEHALLFVVIYCNLQWAIWYEWIQALILLVMLFLTLLFIQNDVMWKKLDEFFKRYEHFSFCKCTKKHGIRYQAQG